MSPASNAIEIVIRMDGLEEDRLCDKITDSLKELGIKVDSKEKLSNGEFRFTFN